MITLLKRSTTSLAAAAGTFAMSATAFAQDLFGDVPDIGGATDARTGTINVVKAVLDFMALIAVVIIVIAGIRMIASQGEEGAIDTGKKTILWAIIGLVVILLASAIVDFIATEVADNI